jgi:hypothetical protein
MKVLETESMIPGGWLEGQMPAGEILDLFVTFVEDSSQLKEVCWFIGIGGIEDDIAIR